MDYFRNFQVKKAPIPPIAMHIPRVIRASFQGLPHTAPTMIIAISTIKMGMAILLGICHTKENREPPDWVAPCVGILGSYRGLRLRRMTSRQSRSPRWSPKISISAEARLVATGTL